MKQIPEYLNVAVEILNKCADALNNKKHKFACELLDKFDNALHGKSIPAELLFNRLSMAVELSSRLGLIEKSLREVENHLESFNTRPDLKFELLIKAGQMEACVARDNISVKYISEALGIAEAMENNSMIAEAYSAIANMFSTKYEGLAFYFLRHAELYYEKAKNCRGLSIIRIHRALLSWSVSRNYTNIDRANCLKNEAEMLISNISEEGFNPHDIMYLKYARGVILRDEKLLEELLIENADVNMLPNKCRYEEMIIGICIEKEMFKKASHFLISYEKDAKKLHGNEREFKSHISFLRNLVEREKRTYFIPFRIKKKTGEPTNLFDILNHYSLCDEIWALNNNVMRILFPTYRQEGLFDAIKMPDGRVRLYPCAIAFNIFYRGQSKYYEVAQPSLYRKDVSEAERFVERVRYEELKRCIESYPLTNIFRNGIFLTYPDGSQEKLELSIDVLALAQHYGIKTELMDLTTDKFVAAFFATTDFKNGVYIPITDDRKEQGVFYRFSDTPVFRAHHYSPKLRAVGLQPFSRPGEQKGLVYEMGPNENFNNAVISKNFFTHDPQVSTFIFNYMNRSQKLFPKSPLEAHVDAILQSNELSKEAFDIAKKEFYPETSEDTLISYLTETGISIVDGKDFSFSDVEKQQCLTSWEMDKDKILSKIIVRLCYRF